MTELNHVDTYIECLAYIYDESVYFTFLITLYIVQR